MNIRQALAADIETIKTIAVETDMFSSNDAGFVDETVNGALDGSLADHRWIVAESNDGTVIGAAYYAPEPFSDRMWNLYFISVSPSRQGSGVGGLLIDHVEGELRRRGPGDAQVLIVETSSTDQYALTREFYPKHGFVEEARIRRFYGLDDDKVVFWKLLTANP
jgi:ribosomal protein S18 acetylase RimI-like enzyme